MRVLLVWPQGTFPHAEESTTVWKIYADRANDAYIIVFVFMPRGNLRSKYLDTLQYCELYTDLDHCLSVRCRELIYKRMLILFVINIFVSKVSSTLRGALMASVLFW